MDNVITQSIELEPQIQQYSSLPLVFEQPIQNLIYYDVSGHKLRSRGLNL